MIGDDRGYLTPGLVRCFLNFVMLSWVCCASSLAGSMIKAITLDCFFPNPAEVSDSDWNGMRPFALEKAAYPA